MSEEKIEPFLKELDLDLKAAHDKLVASCKANNIDPEVFVRSYTSFLLFTACKVGIASWLTTEPPQPMYIMQNWLTNALDRAWDVAEEKYAPKGEDDGTEDTPVAS